MNFPLPAKRLAAFYFTYYSLLGVLHPFWPIFLTFRGFSPAEIGQLMAIQMGTRIVSPNLWGWLADHTGKRVAVVRLGSLLACLSFGGIFFAQGFWSMALVMAAYSFFWNAVMPQFEALTFDFLHDKPERYSAIRLWGSVGFIITVLVGGSWFQARIDQFTYAGLLFLILIWLSSLWLPSAPHRPLTEKSTGFMDLLWSKPVLAFFGISFLLQVSHGIYYGFFSIALEEAGYPRSAIGQFWALSVIAEIILFMVMHRLLTNWSLWGLFSASLAITVARWLIIAHWADSLAALLVAQILHAFSFGACHAVGVEYLRRFFPPRHRGQAQALYSSSSFGAGGAAGALLGGYLWTQYGLSTFDVAAVISLVGFFIAWRWLDHRRRDTHSALNRVV